MSITLPSYFAPLTSLSSYRNKSWLLIFSHNSSRSGLFPNSDAALFSLLPVRFSILSTIEDSWKIDNKFEFMLEYPEHSVRNIWKQSLNPIDDYESARPDERTAQGYDEVSIDVSDNGWGGLVRSSIPSATLLDGSVNYVKSGTEYWYYAVGASRKFYNDESIPFANSSIHANVVKLWIRFDLLCFKGVWSPPSKSFKMSIALSFINLIPII